jgi:hypothetical protein
VARVLANNQGIRIDGPSHGPNPNHPFDGFRTAMKIKLKGLKLDIDDGLVVEIAGKTVKIRHQEPRATPGSQEPWIVRVIPLGDRADTVASISYDTPTTVTPVHN